MVLIIGGAYQGKLDYAKAAYGLKESEIFTCTSQTREIDFSKKCIDHIECFVLACVQRGTDAQAYFQSHAADWAGSILICQDISGEVSCPWAPSCGHGGRVAAGCARCCRSGPTGSAAFSADWSSG